MLRQVQLPRPAVTGKLYLCSMPGRFEPLAQFQQEAEEVKLGHIVCLVPNKEIAHLSPDYLAAIKEDRLPAKLWHFPISEFGKSPDLKSLKTILDQICDRLKQGESAAIHCAYGHCRTGMAARLLLARMGLPFQESVDAIAHAGSTPSAKLESEFQ